MPKKMGSLIIEQEIQNHKNKLNKLIIKLINTHNVVEESSINNEIKKETEFLASLLNIKRNELNPNNNIQNNTNNIFFNQMPNQNNINNDIMNNNLMEQQQMAHQQMMPAQSDNQPVIQNILNVPIINNASSINNQMIPQNAEFWNLVFKYPNHSLINIVIDPNKYFIEAIDMFKSRIGINKDFIFLWGTRNY